jgi:hypothetical protein
MDWAGWALFGLVATTALTALVPLLAGVHPRMASHRAGPASTAALEPPGLLGLNYGTQTPSVAAAAHIAYGIALGVLLKTQ